MFVHDVGVKEKLPSYLEFDGYCGFSIFLHRNDTYMFTENDVWQTVLTNATCNNLISCDSYVHATGSCHSTPCMTHPVHQRNYDVWLS